MKRLAHDQRGTRQIRAYYWWNGIAYPLAAVRDRYRIAAVKACQDAPAAF